MRAGKSGLSDTGKTTFAYSLGEALNRQVVRIPFGGMGAARDLRGQSRLHLEAEPGYVIKALARAKTNNPVVLLDEIDRVSDDARRANARAARQQCADEK